MAPFGALLGWARQTTDPPRQRWLCLLSFEAVQSLNCKFATAKSAMNWICTIKSAGKMIRRVVLPVPESSFAELPLTAITALVIATPTER